ncbi:MAG TPA: delta-60 repeat domain-containing protein, partial [Pyrinomonadaceae bacterium]|nr:delta-60 repeat domain-containing protein [Pyrinomonadaceae bacterium]
MNNPRFPSGNQALSKRTTNASFTPPWLRLAGLATLILATAFFVIDRAKVHSADAGGRDHDLGHQIAVNSASAACSAESTNPAIPQTQCIAGDLDTSFNPGAGVTREASTTGFAQAVNAFAVQPDGKILGGGRFVQNDDSGTRLVARFNTDGSRDTSFSSPGPSDKIPSSAALPRVATLALQSDGKIVIGGDFKINGESRNGIARLNSDGSLDASFNPGTGVNNEITTLAVQPDGKIVIGGDFTQYNGVSRPRVARLNADGSLDTSFAPGTGANLRVQALAIQGDGKIIIGGSFSTYNGVTRNDLARLNTNGSLDTTLGSGTGANEIRTLAIQTDGRVIIGGTFTTYNGVGRNRVARINTNGSLDTSFDPGTGANSTVRAIAIQADGKIVIGGAFDAYNGIVRAVVARINTNGALDTTFVRGTGATQYGAFASVGALALQADGKIVVTGAFDTFDSERRNRVARLNADGSLDSSFISTTVVASSVRVIAVQCDGKIIIGGFFDQYDGMSRNNIARINSDGSLDPTFNPGSGTSGNEFFENGAIEAIVIQPDGKILIGGSFNLYNGIARHKFARLNNNGSLDTSFDPGTGPGEFFANVYAIALQPDGKILVGGFFPAYNDVSRDGLARSNSDGSLDPTFDPLTTIARVVDDFALQPDGKILIGGNFDKSLGRLNTNGSPDGSFNTGTGENGGLIDLVLQPDGKVLIGGLFTQF